MRPLHRILIVLVTLSVFACATNPATGKRQVILMSEQDEIQLGRQSDAEVRKQMGVYKDPNLQRYVGGIGQRLARAGHRPNLPWAYTVVDSPAVNAFALPGGFIYVTRGILPFLRDEAELAAVLGHETGHVDARHSAQDYSKQTLAGGGLAVLGVFVPQARPLESLADVAFGLLFLRNSREHEMEADQLGVGYIAASGWRPESMTGVLGTLGRLDEASGSSRGIPNWALTHPLAQDRIAKVQDVVAAARTSSTASINKGDFERYLDGLVFGDSREQGIVRGNELLHPELRFAVRFPGGWEVFNGAEQVTARETEKGNVAMVLQLAESPSGSVEQTARTDMARFREQSGQRTQINGLPAYVGVYEGTVNNTSVRLHAAHIQAGGKTYVLAGLATPAEFSRADPAFTATIGSFRELSRQEADRIQPNKIDFYTVRNGDTWDSIARNAARGNVKPSTLAIMNGSDPGATPRPGDRIRIVVSG